MKAFSKNSSIATPCGKLLEGRKTFSAGEEADASAPRMVPLVLVRDFGQYVHPLDPGRNSEIVARPLFHAHDLGMAAHPALLPSG
jgi:hypothetical protein